MIITSGTSKIATSSTTGFGGFSIFTSGVFFETFIGSTLKSGIAAYSKTNAPVNIFICSFLPDKEEYAEVQDFIIPLSRDIYQDIIDNSILVEGFEELFNNLLSECQENIKEVKDGCFVKYYN